MPWRRKLAKLFFSSEILLVDLLLGLDFALFPQQISQRLTHGLLGAQVWAVLFLIAALLGFVALAKSSRRLWRLFCCLNIFLLIKLSVACALSGSPTGTTTYGVLAYSAYLRSLGVPAINLFWEGR